MTFYQIVIHCFSLFSRIQSKKINNFSISKSKSIISLFFFATPLSQICSIFRKLDPHALLTCPTK